MLQKKIVIINNNFKNFSSYCDNYHAPMIINPAVIKFIATEKQSPISQNLLMVANLDHCDKFTRLEVAI